MNTCYYDNVTGTLTVVPALLRFFLIPELQLHVSTRSVRISYNDAYRNAIS